MYKKKGNEKTKKTMMKIILDQYIILLWQHS